MKHETVVAGVIYQGVEEFLEDLVRSLASQSCTDFDLLIVNDGADEGARALFPCGTMWIKLEERLSVAEIRARIIDYARNRYTKLVFIDTDDFYSADRVGSSISWLDRYDFVYNDISLVDREGRVLSPRYLSHLKVEDELSDFLQLEHRNVIGLSNSAVNLKALPDLCIPRDLVAVDWWIYTVLLLRGRRGKFLGEAISYYRQHGLNTIGMKAVLTPQKLELGLSVKRKHYSNLVAYCLDHGLRAPAERFTTRLNEVEDLEALASDHTARGEYLDRVNRNYSRINDGWWSEIISMGRLNDYE